MLTSAQKVDVRRWAGYAAVAGITTSDEAYIRRFNVVTSLADRLDNLSADEEIVLTDVYLTNLATLETAILSAQDGIDTSEAGTWKSNPREIDDRTRLFNKWRRDMCLFIGIDPGPGLGSGGMTVVRC